MEKFPHNKLIGDEKEEIRVFDLLKLSLKVFYSKPVIVFPYFLYVGFASLGSLIPMLFLMNLVNSLVYNKELSFLFKSLLKNPINNLSLFVERVIYSPSAIFSFTFYLFFYLLGTALCMVVGFSMFYEGLKTNNFSVKFGLENIKGKWWKSLAVTFVYFLPFLFFLIILTVESLPSIFREISPLNIKALIIQVFNLSLYLSLTGVSFIFLSFFLVYVYPLISVEDIDLFTAFKKAVSLSLKNFKVTFSYCALVVLLDVIVIILGFILNFLGVFGSTFTRAFNLFLINPLLMGTKTGVYMKLRNEEIGFEPVSEMNWLNWSVNGVKTGFVKFVSFAKKARYWLILLSITLVISYFLGFSSGLDFANKYANLFSEALEKLEIKNLPGKFTLPRFPNFFVGIWFQNWQTSIGLIFSGFIPFITQFMGIFINGYIVGAVLGFLKGVTGKYLLISILPHGVIEIPVFIITAGQGLVLSLETLKLIKGKSSLEKASSLIEDLLPAVVGVLVLYCIAAFIEAFITPALTMKALLLSPL